MHKNCTANQLNMKHTYNISICLPLPCTEFSNTINKQVRKLNKIEKPNKANHPIQTHSDTIKKKKRKRKEHSSKIK